MEKKFTDKLKDFLNQEITFGGDFSNPNPLYADDDAVIEDVLIAAEDQDNSKCK